MRKYYVLTQAQIDIWNMEKYLPNTSINNIAASLKFKEGLDFKLLESAINLVVKKTMHSEFA